ncbi:hypothetical protein LJK87_08800 [Paenibacillus sp. P25]|nr:hypothetical protein LJK87_08800 [Paenibacillus sp. P25]
MSYGPLVHRVPCFGYRIVEKPLQGKLDVEKLKALGLTSGPLFGKIKKGEHVTFAGRYVAGRAAVYRPFICRAHCNGSGRYPALPRFT